MKIAFFSFAELGGAVAAIVPDNLKAAVIRAAFGVDGAASLNRSYRELARHYGIKIDPAPIYAPKKKGKVESSVKYVKANFFAARDGHEVDDTRRELQRWVDEIANTRTHGTTHRRPIDLFADERAALLAIPDRRFELVTWHHGRVHLDTYVAFDKRLYSAPWPLIGQMVWVRATAEDVVIFADDVRVTTHDRRGRTVRSTYEEHLPENRAPWRHRDRAYWESRADQIFTSNRDIEEWPPLFGDLLLASAALDRLLHHAHVIEMEGDTFRNPPAAKRAKNSGVTVHVDHAMLMAIVSAPRVGRTGDERG